MVKRALFEAMQHSTTLPIEVYIS